MELQPDHLKIEPDHVLADMLLAMHLTVREATEAFEPEGGAYSSAGHTHAQGEHGNGHALPQVAAQPKPISLPIATAAPHVHGPGCNHGHNP